MAKQHGKQSSKIKREFIIDGKRLGFSITPAAYAATKIDSKTIQQQVLCLSAHLGGPDTLREALRWLAHESRLQTRSAAVEAAIWFAQS